MERQDDHEVYDERVVGPVRAESAEHLQQMEADGIVNTAAEFLRQLRTRHPSITPSVPLIPSQSEED